MASHGNSNKSERITRSERNILQLLSEGLSDREIATRLVLSLSTVKWHIKNIYTKLGVERRVQAVNRARELGLVNFPIPAVEPLRDRLPPDTTSFVDRRIDTERILETLDDPACRLLTLVGSGGIGKTRLAIHAARRTSSNFRDGKVFISLVGVSSVTALAPTIANALSFSFYGAEEPETQLLRYLSNKALLLVIDNYEQFLPDASLLIKILEHAAAIKLLVTSRERLNVREEWLFQVEGLPVTTLEKHDLTREHDAFDLFVQRASQINPNFRGIGQDAPFVVEICRQVEGIPLALELAAGWARSLTAKEIAEQMNKSFKLLTTGVRNIPERHRSMRVVFEETWARLTAQEQMILEALSVFRGGFTSNSAENVAGADLNLLAVLQDKSLISLGSTGRYEMHELLRQFAEAKLAGISERHRATMDKHCQYFADLLWENRRAVLSSHQRLVVSLLNSDIDNIQQAWQWLVDQGDWAAFELAWETVMLFYYVTSRFHEGISLFSLVLDHVRPAIADPGYFRAHSIAHAIIAILSFMIDEVDAGLNQADEALALVQKLNINDPRIRLYIFDAYALLFWAKGEYQKALEQCQLLQEIAAQAGDPFHEQLADYDFGIVYFRQGDFERARTHFYQLAEKNTELGRAYASNFLGLMAEASGDFHDAKILLSQSLDKFRELENTWGVGMSLINLGRVIGQSSALREAAACLYEALDLALYLQTPQQTVGAIAEIAYLLPAIHQERTAVMLMEFLQIQSAAWQEYSERIAPYLAKLRLLAHADPENTVRTQSPFTAMADVIQFIQVVRPQFQTLS